MKACLNQLVLSPLFRRLGQPMATMNTILIALSTAIAWRIYSFILALKSVNNMPGMRPPFSPLSLVGVIFPVSWWNPGLGWEWEWRKTTYFNHRHDIISMVPFIFGSPAYYTGSLDVTKQILGNEGRSPLIKPRELTAPLLLWGDNLVSANDEMWKRHRRILGPSFTANTYNLVVRETSSVYKEMIASEGWHDKRAVFVQDFNKIPLRFAFVIIARCGFGLPMSWAEDRQAKMSLGEALDVVSRTWLPRLILPRWAFKCPIKKLRDIGNAWQTLAKLMDGLVETRRQDLSNDSAAFIQRGDLFTRLVEAYEGEAKYGLEKQEVIGNTFTFMFAGHETTASALNATLGLLAIHQDEQEKAYREILQILPSGVDSEFTVENISKLKHTMACFHEALRIYPPGPMLTRDLINDTPIKVTHPVEETIVLKAGSRVIIDMIGVHHNPNTFPDPDKFSPSRWYGISEHDITTFSVGPRACIGRKFSHIEALTFLALFLRDWKVDIPLLDGDTRHAYEERVMGRAQRVGLAFGVGKVPLKLSRRD